MRIEPQINVSKLAFSCSIDDEIWLLARSEFGTPVYIKRGTFFFSGHWALVVDNREYHLLSEDGQPKFKDVLHKTAHLPPNYSPFTGKYLIGWSTIDQEALRKELTRIEADFGPYKFGENDCRTFVALACDKAIDGQTLLFNPCAIIWLPLYLSQTGIPSRSWLSSLMYYGVADATLLHLSFILMQTLIDGGYFSICRHIGPQDDFSGYELPISHDLIQILSLRGNVLKFLREIQKTRIWVANLLDQKFFQARSVPTTKTASLVTDASCVTRNSAREERNPGASTLVPSSLCHHQDSTQALGPCE